MSARTETIKRFLDAYNARDWDAMKSVCAEEVTFHDNALRKGGTTSDAFIDAWKSFGPERMSDDHVLDVSYLDAPDQQTVITTMTFAGTHDGADYLPGIKANGQQARVRSCHVWRFDDTDRLIGHEDFYDVLTVLIGLGHTSIDVSTPRAGATE